MDVIIGHVPTAVLFKGYLEGLTKEYHKLNEELETSFRSANQRYKDGSTAAIFSEEHLKNNLNKTLEEATESFYKRSEQLNKRAKLYISELKKKIVSALSDFDKPSDYAVRVNNALQFVRAEGAEIDDATAAQILSDFINDVPTMQRFRSMIERQKGEKLSDAYGKTTFPLTFGRLNKCEQLFAAFDELESTVDRLYTFNKSDTETEYTQSGVKLSVPMDGYSQQIGEINAVEQAGTLENMVGELFTVTG